MRTYNWTLDSEQARTKFLVDCLLLMALIKRPELSGPPGNNCFWLVIWFVTKQSNYGWPFPIRSFIPAWTCGKREPLYLFITIMAWFGTPPPIRKPKPGLQCTLPIWENPCQTLIQIPMILNQKALYQEMVLSLRHDQSISYARFLQMLHEDFSYVHFSKSVKALQGLQKERSDHLRFVHLHKEKYYKHRAKAKASPFKYISIIMDYTEAIPLSHHHTPPKGWTIKKSWASSLLSVLSF
ncbi:Transposase [Balamuthia mandrillaris]